MSPRSCLAVLAAVLAGFLLPSLAAAQTPDGISASDWSSIRGAYEAARHRVFATENGHRARTHHQQFVAHFDGLALAPRVAVAYELQDGRRVATRLTDAPWLDGSRAEP